MTTIFVKSGLYVSTSFNTTLWVPLFLVRSGPLPPSYLAFRVLEASLMVFGCILVRLFHIIAMKVEAWHWNITTLFICFSSSYYQLFAARIFLIPYEEGFIDVLGSTGSWQSTVLVDANHPTLRVDCENWQFIPLLVGSFLRGNYMLISCCILPSAIAERSFATYYLRDYECTERKCIPIVIFGVAQIACAAVILAVTLRIVGFEQIVVAAFVATLISSAIYFYIKKQNMKLVRKLTYTRYVPENYNLSMKFQLDENVRVMKLIQSLMTLVSLLVTFIVAPFVLSSLDMLSTDVQVAMLITQQFMLHMCVMFTVPTSVLISPGWLRSFMERLPPGALRSRVTLWYRQQKTLPVPLMTREQETNVYFQQLVHVW